MQHVVTIEHGLPPIKRPIASIDIESATAGKEPDPWYDRIISLAVVKILPNANVVKKFWEFNPEIPITPENAAIHGYTNERAKSFPHFSEHCSDVLDAVTGCDFIGFNLNGYDVPLLHREFQIQNIDWNPIGSALTIDAGAIFKKMEARSLSAAVRFYLGREHEGAHGAMSDAEATIEVLAAQLARYTAENMHWEQLEETNGVPVAAMGIESLATFARMGGQKLDLAGAIELNDEGIAVFTHKKMRGVGVIDDYTNCLPGRSYAGWMMKNDFPQNTKDVLRKLIDAYEGR